MPVQTQKLRTLYIMDILLKRTDEQHILNAADLMSILDREYGISADRKTIYGEIATLEEYGLDIIQVKGKRSGYYVASRTFEVPEVKLLVDAVQSSKFITERKSRELMKKLEDLCSSYQAKELRHQVMVGHGPKTENETIYYNVDLIHQATFANSKISFRYVEWNMKKELQYRKNGAAYKVSPWALTWDDENYYLIAYDEEAEKIKYYRVDKIKQVEILEEERVGKDAFEECNLEVFSKKTFGMFGGDDTEVRLKCERKLAGVIVDRFGQDVKMNQLDEEHFYAIVEATVSPQFFGWITGIGAGMEILSPESVRNEYKKYLADIAAKYQ